MKSRLIQVRVSQQQTGQGESFTDTDFEEEVDSAFALMKQQWAWSVRPDLEE